MTPTTPTTPTTTQPIFDDLGWCHDMEAAPKDGTAVLVWFRGRMHVAEYTPVWHPDNLRWCVPEPWTSGLRRNNIVAELTPPMIDGKPIPGAHEGPTAWRPLPEAPEPRP